MWSRYGRFRQQLICDNLSPKQDIEVEDIGFSKARDDRVDNLTQNILFQ